jgi:PAS domain S-box-containing protein
MVEKNFIGSTNDELLIELNALREKYGLLEKQYQALQAIDKDLKKSGEEFEFAWAGNLGRWDWDYKTSEVTFNPKKIVALGYEEDEIHPNVWEFCEMIHPDDYEKTMNNMREHLQGKTPAYEIEYRIRSKNGDYKWFYDRGVISERDEEGKPSKITGIVFDISERKENEEKMALLIKELSDSKKLIEEQNIELAVTLENLKQSEKNLTELNASKDKFFSIISHDLKGPFLAFMNITEIFSQKFDKNQIKELESYGKILYSSAKDLFKLLEQLLEWSRLQTGRIVYSPLNYDIYEFAFNNTFLLEPIANEKSIKIINKVKENTICYCDYQMINTVFRNLVTNAIKFSNSNSEIIIDCQEDEQFYIISVQDSGVGISNDNIDKLFKIEEKYTTIGTNNEKGTGLGLILVKGTKFIFTLPKER